MGLESLFYAFVIIIVVIVGVAFISDIMLIDHYSTQTRDIIMASASECFGGLSLENISTRDNDEYNKRVFNLNLELKNRFIESIKANLELDDSFTASPRSFVSDREPVKLRELMVINKDILPYQFNDTEITEESIIVIIDLPIELSMVKDSKWIKISQVISLESFLTSKEVSN